MSTFKTYNLSKDRLTKIARLCVQEQGSIQGVKAEASQAANLLETNAKYREKYGDDIYGFMRNSGWYYKAAHFMDEGEASSAAIEATRDVLVNGNRIFPQYVDEHDCISDIAWAKTDGVYINKSDKSKYVKGSTIIRNNFGSTYTFYAFPAPGCDPFGYTQSAYDYVMKQGGEPITPEVPDDRLTVPAKLPELYKDCPKSKAVQIWRLILGMKSRYNTFNENVKEKTKEWQKSHGLASDGIVGEKTWEEAFKTLT